MRVVCLFDGSCLHGVDGAGAAVAYDSSGAELARRARYLPGPDVTVNVAEYVGLTIALELARDLSATDVRVLGDSELIVRQFNLVYACRQVHLRPLLEAARSAALALRCPVEVDVLPKTHNFPANGGHGAVKKARRRNGNAEADALAGECRRARRSIP